MFRTPEFLGFKKNAFPARPVYHVVNKLLGIDSGDAGRRVGVGDSISSLSPLLPLCSVASVVEEMAVFILAQVISIVF